MRIQEKINFMIKIDGHMKFGKESNKLNSTN
jgi:hypothetical protein